jgi:hypothetical protein
MKPIEAPERDCNQTVHEPPQDNHSPLLLRSKAEQLTGHQLIRALNTFKHQEVASAPLSSFFVHASPEKGKVVMSMEDKQCCSPKLKSRIKFRKSGFKVVRDLLAKKWIFVKTQKQLDDLTPKPLTVCKIEDIKKFSEVALFMEAIRNLTEASEKDKNRVNLKHNSTRS